jgi:hypothetical protein
MLDTALRISGKGTRIGKILGRQGALLDTQAKLLPLEWAKQKAPTVNTPI